MSVRIRSPYFETHRDLDPDTISDADYRMRFRCIRAHEIARYPAFWLIKDAVHRYHELSPGQLRARCHG